MTYETRKLNPNDINLAKELFLFFQIDDGVVNPTLGSDEYLRDLLSRNDFHVIGALQNETIIGGLVGYELAKYKEETTVMFLYEIGVSSSFRRKGIATKIRLLERDLWRKSGLKSVCRYRKRQQTSEETL